MTKKVLMEERTASDFKNILSKWKKFQHQKLKTKMENTYQCNFASRSNGIPYVLYNLRLTFVTEPEPHLLFRDGLVNLVIALSDLNGYNTEEHTIELILQNQEAPRIEFPTEVVYQLALAQFNAFTRDMPIPLLPTPPSSASSYSSASE